MPRRREFSRKTRAAAFERAGGKCEKCTARLYPGKFAYDHIIPDAMGGEPVLDNCQVLCSSCHGAKTSGQDAGKIAKTKRIRDKHMGAFPKSRSVIPGSRGSVWKRKIDGTTERRKRD